MPLEFINVALFGMTAKEWREANQTATGNIRDDASILQLIVLVNLENLNAEYIKQGIAQQERLALLNQTAISQLKSLAGNASIRQLENK